MTNLRPRLKIITEMLQKYDLICDIGTDHAYLPIYLLENNLCKEAIITDINQGPLNNATSNIKRKKLEKYVEPLCGDGLKPLCESKLINKNRQYVIIMAGMGGILIEKILKEGICEAKKASSLIIQPMSRIEIITKWLIEEGFEIYDESLVKDDGRIYTVLAAKWTGIRRNYKLIDLYIGKKLIEKKDPLLKEYINWKISIINKIILNLQNYKHDSETKNNKGNLTMFNQIKEEMINVLESLK